MRIVTLNTWKNEGDYHRRLELMAQGLRVLSPDLVCLQECFAAGRDDTATHLADRLGMHAYRRPSRVKPRAHRGAEILSACGLALLSKEPLQGEAAISLSADPRDGERDAQRADLVVEGRPLRILNLHLTHLPDGADLRRRQLDEALDWALRDFAGDLVVAGDFNASREDAELTRLRSLSPPAQGATLRGRSGRLGDRAIDHVLLLRGRDWIPTSSQVVLDAIEPDGTFPSDHAGLLIELAAQAGPPAGALDGRSEAGLNRRSGSETRPVVIVPYDRDWPDWFALIRSRLAVGLGTIALDIEHVGSTAVPGLGAKPIIDIDIVLASDADLPLAIERLATIGYVYEGELGVVGRHAFRPPGGLPKHHPYVCPAGSSELRRHLAFRDHLRENPDQAQAYERLKRELAERFGADRDGYSQAKKAFVEAALQLAAGPSGSGLPSVDQ